jgi:amino acid adenylation domain-containing protein
LAVVLPRAAIDERGLRLVFNEFLHFYGRTDAPQLPHLGGVSEYLEAEGSEPAVDREALDRMGSLLKGELPSLDLPSKSGTRPVSFSGRGRTITRAFDPGALRSLEESARALEVSVETVQLAVFVATLQRYCNQEDFVIGLLFATRPWSGVACNETRCVLRVNIATMTKLSEAIRQIADGYESARSMAGVPFQELVQTVSGRRDASRTALYQAAFEVLEPALPPREVAGVLFSEQLIEASGAATDLTIKVRKTSDGGEILLEYASDILSDEMAASILESYHFGTSALSEHLTAELGRLPLMDARYRERSFFPLKPLHFDKTNPVFRQLSERARNQPDAVAVLMKDRVLSYAQLEEASNRLAHRLRKHGVGEDMLVGIYCERSVDMLIALLAAHKAGAAYVPLDPKHPRARIEATIEDSSPRVLITQSYMRSSCPVSADVLLVEMDDPTLELEPADTPNLEFNPESLAYVIFTSGSTGRPKGVEISHRAFTNFIASMASSPGMAKKDRILSVTTLSFDIAGLELFLPLFVGGSVEIADHETCVDADRLKARLADPAVTFFQATPATFRLLVESSWKGKAGLKLLCGGEAFPPDLVRSLLNCAGEVWNVYGPTETTVWSTSRRLTDDAMPVPVGRPIDNTSIYLLNPCQEPVPRGAVGEIWIGGEGVARGYRGRPDLSAERFVPDPFSPQGAARMYRTGDLGRISTDEELVCLGRVDFQVKIRGFRIELGDIEVALLDIDEVSQAVVVAREDTPGDKRLIAYVVAVGDPNELTILLRNSLRDRLPVYMIPANFIFLSALPLNSSGKIDRSALPATDLSAVVAECDEGLAVDDTELLIRAVFAEILGTSQFSMEDSFFDIGGNSLLAVRLLRDLEASVGIRVSLASLFENSSVRSIARSIGEEVAEGNRPRVVKLRSGESNERIFCIYGVALYQHLARSLPKRFGVYGVYVPVETQMFDAERLRRGELRVPTVSELAMSYLEAIREQQPKGPYLLLGLSFGGVIAYELARLLREAGEEVRFLGLLDALLPQAIQLSGVRRKLSLLREFCGSSTGWSVYAKIALGRLGFPSKRDFTEGELQWLRDRINTVQVHRYAADIRRYQGDVILVHAGDRGDFTQGVVVDAAAGWRVWIEGVIHEYVVPGRHLAIVERPHVEELAEDLSGHLIGPSSEPS